MLPYNAHSWVAELQSQNRGYRGTIICPYMVMKYYIVLLLHFPAITLASPYVSSVPHSSSASNVDRTPSNSKPSCYHHRLETHDHGLRTAYSQSSRISRAKLYRASIFYLLKTYASTSSKITSQIASSKGGTPNFRPGAAGAIFL